MTSAPVIHLVSHDTADRMARISRLAAEAEAAISAGNPALAVSKLEAIRRLGRLNAACVWRLETERRRRRPVQDDPDFPLWEPDVGGAA